MFKSRISKTKGSFLPGKQSHGERERAFEGKNRNSSLTGHTNGVVALIGEKSIHWLFPQKALTPFV